MQMRGRILALSTYNLKTSLVTSMFHFQIVNRHDKMYGGFEPTLQTFGLLQFKLKVGEAKIKGFLQIYIIISL